jgi:hypothetical protein
MIARAKFAALILVFVLLLLTACNNSRAAYTPEHPEDSTTSPGAVATFFALPGNGRVTLGWTAPADDGGAAVSGYKIKMDGSEKVWITKNADQLTHAFNNLSNGTLYSFTIAAVNIKGSGKLSSVTATPRTESLSLLPPETSRLSPINIRADIPGTDTEINPGYDSVPLSQPPTPATVPRQVTNITVKADDGKITLSWEPPADDGGLPVTSYKIKINKPDPESETWTDTLLLTHTFKNLTNFVLYSFTIAAVNAKCTETHFGAESSVIAAPFPKSPPKPDTFPLFDSVELYGSLPETTAPDLKSLPVPELFTLCPPVPEITPPTPKVSDKEPILSVIDGNSVTAVKMNSSIQVTFRLKNQTEISAVYIKLYFKTAVFESNPEDFDISEVFDIFEFSATSQSQLPEPDEDGTYVLTLDNESNPGGNVAIYPDEVCALYEVVYGISVRVEDSAGNSSEPIDAAVNANKTQR